MVRLEKLTVPDLMKKGRTSPASLLLLLLTSPLTVKLPPIKAILLSIRTWGTAVNRTFVVRVIVSSPAAVFASKMALLNVPATVPVPLSVATVTSKLASVDS